MLLRSFLESLGLLMTALQAGGLQDSINDLPMLAFAAERGEAFAKINQTACWLGRKPPAELANHGYFQRQRRKCFGMLVQQVRTCSPPFRCRQESRVISADEHRIDPAALVSAEARATCEDAQASRLRKAYIVGVPVNAT